MTRILSKLKTYLLSGRAVAHPTGKVSLVVVLVTCSVALGIAVRAYTRTAIHPTSISKSTPLPAPQAGKAQPSRLQAKLALQPEADRFRRRLGERFTKPGRESATLVGTLSVGAQQYQVRIVRTQKDDGEALEVALGGGPASLTWNANEGAKSGASLANGVERPLIERLALDSPDQFIQAQLRMASYYTIARNVMPAEAHGGDDYTGPVWDVVRVIEPKGEGGGLPLSPVRHYFLNSSTGLLEKVVSDEQGQTIVAELSGWTNQGGELLPTHIVWRRDNQVIMELTVNGFLTGPRA